MDKDISCEENCRNLVLPHDSSSIYIAVQDHVYDEIPLTSNPEDKDIQHRTYGFVVDDWIRTKEISNQLKSIFDKDLRDSDFYFGALTLNLLEAKQKWFITYGKCFSRNRFLYICC